LAPLPDKIDALNEMMSRSDRYRRGRLLAALAECVRDLFAVSIDATDWDRARIEPHLLINIRVIDEDGQVVAQGRDLSPLQAQFMEDTRTRVDGGAGEDFTQTNLTAFPDTEVPAEVVLRDVSGSLVGYPTLVDEGRHVALRIVPSKRERDALNRDGYARLAWLSLGSVYGYFKRELAKKTELGLRYVTLGDAATLTDAVLLGVAWYCFFEGKPLPETRTVFDRRMTDERPRLADVFNVTVDILDTVLKLRFDLTRRLDELGSPAFAFAVQDVKEQVAALVPPDLLSRTPSSYLTELPRYLEAAHYRLSQLQGKVQRDREAAEAVRARSERIEAIWATELVDEAAWNEARFVLEGLRVGLFAERMGTRGSISLKKMDRILIGLERQVGLR
jgi:ATP-dependent helicase HrpA